MSTCLAQHDDDGGHGGKLDVVGGCGGRVHRGQGKGGAGTGQRAGEEDGL